MDSCNRGRLEHTIDVVDRCRHLIIGTEEYMLHTNDGWKGHAYEVETTLLGTALRDLAYARDTIRDVLADD